MIKKRDYAKALILKRYIFSLVVLCLLFSSYLSAQSFSDNPQVFISSGTLISEAKSTQTEANKQKIFVVKGTLVTGTDNVKIAYINNTSTKKKPKARKSAENQTLAKEKTKQNTVHKATHTFVLKPASSGNSFFAYGIQKDIAVTSSPTHQNKGVLNNSLHLITRASTEYKLNIASKNKNILLYCLYTNHYDIRPPPILLS